MSEAFLGSCKAALNNLIASEAITEHENPYTAFLEALLNFLNHVYLVSKQLWK